MLKKIIVAAILAAMVYNIINTKAYADELPSVSAHSAVVMHSGGEIVFEKNADETMLIASTTKIMTALVVLEHCDLNETVEILPEYCGMEGSSMYLKEGEQLTLETLLYGLMLCSGNDAAVAIADHVGGSQAGFVKLMNETARELGMDNSSFANPNGLDDADHYSTARDMAALACAAMENETLVRIVSTRSVTIGGRELSTVKESALLQNVTLVSLGSHLFKGTVADNLRMAAPTADDAALWAVLEQVRLADFLRSENGLDTQLNEGGSNLSGGQRQRLALARALLHDSPVYIFDEATSNIDVESENDIMAQIQALAGKKTVILISHRLANVTVADNIYVLDHGTLAEQGTHEALLAAGGTYARLWTRQQELENYGKEAAPHA